MWHTHDGGDWAWMGVFMVLFWVPFLLLIVWAVIRGFGGPGPSGGRRDARGDESDGARELARRAYARGEITRERFLEIIEDLDSTERSGGG
jgi:uncharacterized membrane protein